ncbi:MAG: hypothetical protein GF333_04365 [Candidatus Omnitrophica bacterium]|nr:hypothetical protein [Candidatus Omnitrophota bacterium]
MRKFTENLFFPYIQLTTDFYPITKERERMKRSSVDFWFREEIRRKMEEYQREILVALLRDQMKELQRFAELVESGRTIRSQDLESFFNSKVKKEKKVLKTIF